MPISASYSAVEMDELDEWISWAPWSRAASTSVWPSMKGTLRGARGGVGMIDEMNATLEAAEDDPSANRQLPDEPRQRGPWLLRPR
jgi:hypothetical protein